MDIMEIINKKKEKSIVKFLMENTWSNFLFVYDEIVKVIESNCKESRFEKDSNGENFGDYILKGTVTDELLNDIASILITHKEIELFEEKNRNMIKRATFDVLLNENISPIINSSIENDEYKIEIFDSTYVPF